MKKRLNSLADKLVISRKSDKRQNIKWSLRDLEDKLQSHFKGEITKTERFGSWNRNTILPREHDPDSDVDLLVLFNDESKLPGYYRNELIKFMEKHYPDNPVKKDNPAVTLDQNRITYELVPAIKDTSDITRYKIPNPADKNTWLPTSPKELKLQLKSVNQTYKGLVSRIIRLCKYWNTYYKHKLSSYKLERLVIGLNFKQEDIYSGFLSAMNMIIKNEITEVINAIAELEKEKQNLTNEEEIQIIEKQIIQKNSILKKHESTQNSLVKIEQYRNEKRNEDELKELRILLPKL